MSGMDEGRVFEEVTNVPSLVSLLLSELAELHLMTSRASSALQLSPYAS
jgi:hypothetical protein